MSDQLTIPELLEAGLKHYGFGEIDKALECWQEVLRQDPDNEAAREYLEIEMGHVSAETKAEEEIMELSEEFIEPLPAPVLSEEFIAGQFHLNIQDIEKAVASFENAHREDPQNPIYWAHVELARAGLIKEVIATVGGLGRPIRLKVPLNNLIGAQKFTQEEGFVLSLITGDLGLEDLTALSPIPRYKTYEIIYRLLRDNLAEPVGKQP